MYVIKYYSAGGMKKDGVLSYLLPDMLGSTNIALKANGSVQAVQLFAPFGGTHYSDGSINTPYNYTGQRLDTTSGLLYYNARYYDSTIGRFTSTDSVETNGNGLDPYANGQMWSELPEVLRRERVRTFLVLLILLTIEINKCKEELYIGAVIYTDVT